MSTETVSVNLTDGTGVVRLQLFYSDNTVADLAIGKYINVATVTFSLWLDPANKIFEDEPVPYLSGSNGIYRLQFSPVEGTIQKRKKYYWEIKIDLPSGNYRNVDGTVVANR